MGNQNTHETRKTKEMSSKCQMYLAEKRARDTIYYADKKARRHAYTARSNAMRAAYQLAAKQRAQPYLDSFLLEEKTYEPSADLSDETDIDRYHRLINEKLRWIKYESKAAAREELFKNEFEYSMQAAKKEHAALESTYRLAHTRLEDDFCRAAFPIGDLE